MRKLLTAAAVLALSLFWACHLGPEDSQDHFDLIGDSTWTECDSVVVVLLDSKGKEVDTLFKGKLESVAQLKNLSAAGYDGTTATLLVRGTKAGGLCFEEKRTFEGDGQSLKVDTLKSLTAEPKSVEVEPDSLVIALDAAAVPVGASILPSYADQSVVWSLAADGVVSLTSPTGGAGNQVKIKPEKIGNTTVTVHSKKDLTKFALLKVRVTAPSGVKVELNKDSLFLFVGGAGDSLAASIEPATVDQKVIWSSMNPAVVTVDSAGRVKPVGVGETFVNAKSVSTGSNGSALVKVKRDVPKLTVASKTGAPVNTRIVFSPRSTQEHGSIVMYKWDLDGDGNWDDSSSTPGIGEVVDLLPQSTSYSKEGTYTPKFYVRDSEGNDTTAQVTVDIGNQAPEIMALRADTSISIKDSIRMTASVRDVDGKVVWSGWDYDGDGDYEDSLVSADSSVEVVFGHRYPDAGLHLAIFKAMDETGKARLDTAKIKVELDRPVADAGEDITVTVGAQMTLHVDGTDKYGKIEKRELRFHGTGTGFHEISKPDTTVTAPNEVGVYLVVVRVTDDDGLVDIDSMNVNVILSANAELLSLVFSAGPLDPVFKPTIQFFSANAKFGDSSVTVTPTVKDASSTISVNAKPVASGTPSSPVKLVVGSNLNVFQIVVTAADGTQRVYNLSVARDPSADATLSKLDVAGFTLKPLFAANKVNYADTVPSTVTSVTLKPTLASSTATLSVNDSAMASGTATFPQPLAIGENIFKIVVTSQSGTTTTTYQVKVIRRAQLILTRSLAGKPATQTDSSEVVPGAALSIISAPVTGYHFLRWTVKEGTALLADSAANPGSLTLQSAKVRAQAEFAINKYGITAGANAGGSISPSGIVSVDHGLNQAFTVTINPGHRLKSLSVDGTEAAATLVNGVYTFINVTAEHSINAAFVKVDTITTKVGAGGTILPAKSPVLVDAGSDTTFTLNPAGGFKIATFKVDGVDALDKLDGNKFTFKAVSGNHSLEATFVEGFTLSGVDDNGATVTPNSIGVNKGDNQTFTIAPKSPDYRIKTLLDNGKDVTSLMVGNTYTLTNIDAPHTIVVVSIRLFTLTVDVSGTGTGKVDPGTVVVDSLTSRTFKFEANMGSRLTSLKADGADVPNTGSHTFSTITAKHTLSLVFTKVTYPLTGAVTLGAGSIAPTSTTVDTNGSQIFTFGPAANYRFHQLIDNEKPVEINGALGEYPLTGIKSKHDVKVLYWRQYSVTGVNNELAKIGISVAKPDSFTGSSEITVTPKDGYRVVSISDFGTVIPMVFKDKWGPQTFTLKEIVADHQISVEVKRFYTLTATSDVKTGSVSPLSINVDSLGSTDFTLTPVTGFHASNIVDNEKDFAPIGNIHSVSNILEDHKITAIFTSTPTFKLVVGDSAVLNKGENSTSRPKICVLIGKSEKEVCQVSPATFEMDGGTTFRLSADDQVSVCNDLFCGRDSKSWFEWVQISTKGGTKVLEEPNPMSVQILNTNVFLKAVYGDAVR